MSLEIYEGYSERSFVVRGDGTKDNKEFLKKLGGKWNTKLTGGSGWIFSNKHLDKVKKFIDEGIIEEESSDKEKIEQTTSKPVRPSNVPGEKQMIRMLEEILGNQEKILGILNHKEEDSKTEIIIEEESKPEQSDAEDEELPKIMTRKAPRKIAKGTPKKVVKKKSG